jgi:integrase/recombinase XerD
MLDLISAYENYLTKVKQASVNTVSSYMRDIRQFAVYLEGYGKIELTEVQQFHIQNYLTHMIDDGRSGATQSRNVASLKNFYSYLVSVGFMDKSPVFDIQVEKREKKLPLKK